MLVLDKNINANNDGHRYIEKSGIGVFVVVVIVGVGIDGKC